MRLVSDTHTPVGPPLLRYVLAAAPHRVRYLLRLRKGAVAVAILVPPLTLSFVFLDLVYDTILECSAGPAAAASTDVWGPGELDAPKGAKAVLVQHHDPVGRLNVTLTQECAFQTLFRAKMRLIPQLLPSWTLHRVRANCINCTDTRDCAFAAKGVQVHDYHGVFFSSSAPLSRVGPMLFAMSSVTNDVAVREELTQWSWLRHVYPSLSKRLGEKGVSPAAEAGAPVRRPYLAVMGVPSTDQPSRVALRVAQRATWMTYEEVARTENNFQGALLPLHLFAAAEPSVETTTTVEVMPAAAAAAVGDDGMLNDGDATEGADARLTTTTTARQTLHPPRPGGDLCGHTDSLLPTVRDYQQASKVLAGGAAEGFVQRRVVLRADYDTAELSQSPCRGVTEMYVSAASVAELPLSRLAKHVGLNVTPAFVSAAEFVCCASASLWREALVHRNVVWIDMMTDRKPTTNKRLGDTAKWGLPVEVGMSQKLILWLLYAHNSFTDVPYNIKGDDDMYLKVPQLLNDVRCVSGGARHRDTSPFGLRLVASETTTTSPTEVAAVGAL